MKRRGQTTVLIHIALLYAACGSVEETSKETPLPLEEQPAPVVQEPAIVFEARTDTVATHSTLPPKPAEDEPVEIHFMVQIGAYKDPSNASAVQRVARERYKMPVMNDYNAPLALYQIRIGFFETPEAAYAFRERLVKEYPGEYGDAWVVQLKR